MSAPLQAIRHEVRPMVHLALPVVLGELGWMAMGVVDTVMVGGVGAEALGAVGIGRALFMFVGVVGIGMILGLDTMVSQAFGAGRPDECNRWLVQGLWLTVGLAVPLTAAVAGLSLSMDAWGVDPAVLAESRRYLAAVMWSMPPLLVYFAARRFLQAVNLVRPVMVALVSANAINLVGDWALIYGKLGAPRLGTAGCGWATTASSVYLALFLLAVIARWDREHSARLRDVGFAVDTARIGRLMRLGLPAAMQMSLEIGVFATSTALAGRLAPAALAAHQVTLTTASVSFMVPLGISSAAAVRVGHALGRRDPPAAGRAGTVALALGAGFMSLAALVLLIWPRELVRLFIADADVVEIGAGLLRIAAVFQLFDGLQVVATGALRGAGDTRTPMLWSIVAYWVLGLPVGWGLCFPLGRGIYGLWIGLSTGLIVAGTVLTLSWARQAAAWNRAAA